MFALVAGLTAFVLTPLLARLLSRGAWADGAGTGDGGRKQQAVPVPVVGGPALLAGLVAAVLVTRENPFAPTEGSVAWTASLGALGLAWATGLVDDLRTGGLGPCTKLAGQGLAGAVLALPACFPAGWGGGVELSLSVLGCAGLWILGAWVFLNAWNTFDNADGAAGGLGALGLAVAASPAGAAPAGFLPWNLLRARGGRGTPVAYLGDSGSHLLGMCVLLTPAAWPVLALPLADLARVCAVRRREGRPPWVGDRCHLAHELQDLGLGTPRVLALLLGLGALPLLVSGLLGLALFAAGFALTCGWLRSRG